ncbi:MAG: hypothetical protein F4Y46_00350 [Chloroflexi bacterium]|nr:hypothetical protein [Chloroflexota bacterium]
MGRPDHRLPLQPLGLVHPPRALLPPGQHRLPAAFQRTGGGRGGAGSAAAAGAVALTLLAAGALGWLALGLVLYVLHRLRPPLPLIEVPSLHPWRRPPRQGRRRLRDWLRRHLALLLQLLALALLALALAHPSEAPPGGGG